MGRSRGAALLRSTVTRTVAPRNNEEKEGRTNEGREPSSNGTGGRRLLHRTPGCTVLCVRDCLDVQKIRKRGDQERDGDRKERERMRM